ncbi:MAG: Abi family protein [Oscillospiraceae bacterium]|nr:Abi family protein [Oscillospiraceae bacterium]
MDTIYLKHINKQIAILKKCNLTIDDYEFIEYILKKENFYYIINAYKKPFLIDYNLTLNKFIDKTTFENIYALYEFDIELKSIIFKHISKVESAIKSYIYQIFYKCHGDITPLKPSNFNLIDSGIGLEFIKQKILSQINSNSEISHFSNEYGIVPLWAIINILNFEEISKFFSIMKSDEKDQVVSLIDENLTKLEFSKYLNILIEAKNICTENLTMYNFASKYKLNFIDIFSYFNYIPESKSNVFTILVLFKIFLSDEDFKDMYKSFIVQLDYLDNSLKNLKFDKVYGRICEEFLGVPDDFYLINV